MNEIIHQVDPESNLSTIEKIKFPRTKHLFTESAKTRDDLLATELEREAFLQKFNSGLGNITEKIDGLNLGIGFSDRGNLIVRHRNDIITDPTDRLYANSIQWAQRRRDLFYDLLKNDVVLYIEWMEWEHTVPYDKLPDYGQVIALYDNQEKGYMSLNYIRELFRGSGLAVVPEINFHAIQSPADCLNLITTSNFSQHTPMEGLFLRIDEGDFNTDALKFVHPNFRQAVDQADHWMKRVRAGSGQRNIINHDAQARLLAIS